MYMIERKVIPFVNHGVPMMSYEGKQMRSRLDIDLRQPLPKEVIFNNRTLEADLENRQLGHEGRTGVRLENR